MARVAKEDREYHGVLSLNHGGRGVEEMTHRADSLPQLLRHFFPCLPPDHTGHVPLDGRRREVYFETLRRGGSWPCPNFHTVARDLRLAPHIYQRIFEAGEGYTLEVAITVHDTSQMRAYRNSGFLDDEQIDRVVARLVGTTKDHEAELALVFPGLPLDLWAESISAAQFWRLVEKNPETGVWQRTQ